MKSSTYKCNVIDRNGNRSVIEKQGESENDVMLSFRGSEYIPVDIHLKKSKTNNSKKKSKAVLEFTQMMEQLLDSGLSLKDSLEVTSIIDSKNKGCSEISKALIEQVQKGTSFSDAVENLGDTFPAVYKGIIKVGNRIGSVEHIFPRLRIYLETTKKIKEKFLGALTYPLMVLMTAVVGVLAMAVFVFPKLQEMFEEFGGDAAKMLQKNISGLKTAVITILCVIVFLILIISLIIVFSKKSDKFKEKMDFLLLKVPFVNRIIIYWNTMNFAFAMETLTSGGVTIESAIKESQSVVSNAAYNKALSEVSEDIVKGISLSAAFSKHKEFPDYVSRWLTVGEKSGKTEVVFAQIRGYFQSAVERIINSFMGLIEPALIILIGIIILIFVVTIVVPIFSLYGSIL